MKNGNETEEHENRLPEEEYFFKYREVADNEKQQKADVEVVEEGRYQKEEEEFEQPILRDPALRRYIPQVHIRLLQDLGISERQQELE